MYMINITTSLSRDVEIRTCFNYHIFKSYGTYIFMNIKLDIFENTFSNISQIKTTRTFCYMPKYVLQKRHTSCIFLREKNTF